ncbi:hypothetical protein HMPREF9018_0518 [Prevotella amnii CRIS 21A-A]|uniref:Uncharacterized protein n=1 Tax=Prevotella amnii CRIS 21A-A TaxID=679191 RepID=E1GWM7_9BACT|nr:hypothetical protein HMPREF9018_0518 [Prevotella amnii CRIS 21A-A]
MMDEQRKSINLLPYFSQKLTNYDINTFRRYRISLEHVIMTVLFW